MIAALLSRKIRDVLKEDNIMPRYKLAVQVFVGEKRDQKVHIVSKGYWDNYVDNYATYTYQDENFYCTVIAFGFYTD